MSKPQSIQATLFVMEFMQNLEQATKQLGVYTSMLKRGATSSTNANSHTAKNFTVQPTMSLAGNSKMKNTDAKRIADNLSQAMMQLSKTQQPNGHFPQDAVNKADQRLYEIEADIKAFGVEHGAKDDSFVALNGALVGFKQIVVNNSDLSVCL